MNRHRLFFALIALAAASLLAGCWGSSKETSLSVGSSTTPAKVGSEQCTNTCHAATPDILGHPIAATWTASMHRTDGNVQCEDCHGGGAIKDFGASRRAARIQNQDRYYPIDARRSFYDASFVFPPMQLAALDGSWGEWQASGSVYEFRSASMGAISRACRRSSGGPR